MNCRVCAIPLLPWRTKVAVALLRCGSCGSIHADCSKPPDDMYADLYARDDAVPEVVAASLDNVVRSMAPSRASGKWLDIGFGQGALLDAAARGDWRCYGTELSGTALDRGQARGFMTASGTEAFEDGSFDVVSLVELLEHVEDPGQFLGEARRVLRIGGCLYVTTPNAWSLNRWFLGESWSVFAPPDHITIFTPRGLHQLLRNAGFGKVALRTEGLNPFEIFRTPLCGGSAPACNRLETGTKLCETLSSSPGRRRIKSLVNSTLSALRLGDSIKARAR